VRRKSLTGKTTRFLIERWKRSVREILRERFYPKLNSAEAICHG